MRTSLLLLALSTSLACGSAPPANDTPTDTSPDVSTDMSADLPNDMPPVDIPADLPADMPADASEDIPADLPDDMPQDDGPEPPPPEPIVSFTFPLTDAILSTATRRNGRVAPNPSLRVRGKGLAEGKLSRVTVNGEDVDSDDGFQTWTADVDLNGAEITLALEAWDAQGAAIEGLDTLRIQQRPVLAYGGVVALDPTRALIWRADHLELLSLDTSLLTRVPADVDNVQALALQGPNAYIYGSDGLSTLDLATGDTEAIEVSGSGRSIRALSFLTPDPAKGRLFFLNNSVDLMVVDLSTGAAQVISNDQVGSGPPLRNGTAITGIAHDPAQDRLYVSRTLDVLSIDVQTGDRTILANDILGTGPSASLRHITYDPSGGLLYGVQQRRLLTLDPATGDRAVFYEFPQRVTGVQSLRWDASNARLLAFDDRHSYVLEVARDTAKARVLAGAHTPRDETLGLIPVGATYDAVYRRILYTDESGRLMSLDLTTRTRSLLQDTAAESFFNQAPRVLEVGGRAHLLRQEPDPALLECDPTSQTRGVLSGEASSGPPFEEPVDMLYDPSGVFYVLEGDRVLTVDATTGARAELGQAPERAAPTSVEGARAWATDAARQRLLVLTRSGVISIDTQTGARQALDLTLPLGTSLQDARGMVIAGEVAYVLLSEPNAPLVRLDLERGEGSQLTVRHTFSSINERAVTLTPGGDLLIVDGGTHGIVQLDPRTGWAVTLLQ